MFQTAPQDIMPELQRFANGKVQDVGNGRYGVILRLSADESTVLKTTTCGIKHILVKVVAIDKDAICKKKKIEKISVLEFEDEVHIHQDVCEASIKKFSCSIAPTLLYAQIYTLPELQQFPSISKHINTTGRIGLIFMEMIETHTDDYPAFNLLEYYEMPGNKDGIIKTMFPKARRLLIMLAQLGFLHNDFHLRNLVCPYPLLYIIDFGRASRMTEEEKDQFNEYVKANDVEKMITFLFGEIKYYINENPTGFLYYQWLNQPQIDTVVPGIDLSIEIASEESIVAPIRFAQDQHPLCVFPPKIPYGEIDRPERERIRLEQADLIEREERKRVEKLEREIDQFEFKEYPPPERSVTVLIRMHGANTEERLPDFPENTIIGGAKVCLLGYATRHDYIKTLKEIYSQNKLSAANQQYERPPPTDEYLERDKTIIVKYNHNKVPQAELNALYKEKLEGRRYIYDREYGLEFDALAIFQGITLIHTNVPELKSLEMPTEVVTIFPTDVISPEEYTNYLEFQRTNLLNVAVATKLDGNGFDRKITKDLTGISHYEQIYLSDILNYFGRFGVQHVNVIDESCRVYDKPFTPARKLSIKEKAAYDKYVSDGKIGGKRRRYKTKRKIYKRF